MVVVVNLTPGHLLKVVLAEDKPANVEIAADKGLLVGWWAFWVQSPLIREDLDTEEGFRVSPHQMIQPLPLNALSLCSHPQSRGAYQGLIWISTVLDAKEPM